MTKKNSLFLEYLSTKKLIHPEIHLHIITHSTFGKVEKKDFFLNIYDEAKKLDTMFYNFSPNSNYEVFCLKDLFQKCMKNKNINECTFFSRNPSYIIDVNTFYLLDKEENNISERKRVEEVGDNRINLDVIVLDIQTFTFSPNSIKSSLQYPNSHSRLIGIQLFKSDETKRRNPGDRTIVWYPLMNCVYLFEFIYSVFQDVECGNGCYFSNKESGCMISLHKSLYESFGDDKMSETYGIDKKIIKIQENHTIHHGGFYHVFDYLIILLEWLHYIHLYFPDSLSEKYFNRIIYFLLDDNGSDENEMKLFHQIITNIHDGKDDLQFSLDKHQPDDTVFQFNELVFKNQSLKKDIITSYERRKKLEKYHKHDQMNYFIDKFVVYTE